MSQPNLLEVDWEAIHHRRHLAKMRRERETERRAYLSKLIRTDRRATQLRAWIDGQADSGISDPVIARMFEWAREQLAALDAVAFPVRMAETLYDRNLFPEVDDLHDPLGEPPVRQPWGR